MSWRTPRVLEKEVDTEPTRCSRKLCSFLRILYSIHHNKWFGILVTANMHAVLARTHESHGMDRTARVAQQFVLQLQDRGIQRNGHIPCPLSTAHLLYLE